MQSRTAAVTTITSQARIRPLPSARGSSRWEITACSDSASRTRSCSCSSGGNTEIVRVIVVTESGVCRVEMTR